MLDGFTGFLGEAAAFEADLVDDTGLAGETGHDDVVAEKAVVRDVDVGGKQIVVADDGTWPDKTPYPALKCRAILILSRRDGWKGTGGAMLRAPVTC